MNRRPWRLAGVLATLFIVAAGTAVGQGYEIDWHTIDGGGVMAGSGSGYELSGTLGQHDAGSLSRGSYALIGGFWQAAATPGAFRRFPCGVWWA